MCILVRDSLGRKGSSVLHPIRKLAREIHRRSVWQVLTVYLGLSWITLQTVAFATRSVGLPLWTPAMATILLLIGLPVVIATAVVQGGLPGLRIEDFVDPNELEGRTPEEVHVIPHAHPMYGVGLFTWRNAILGGVMAAALLTTSVAAYLAMWALGIGPVGSLIAQGVIDPNDPVILADFDSGNGSVGIADAARRAVEEHLGRSTVVTLLSRGGLADALSEMGYDANAPLPRELALSVAQQQGVKAVVDGQVTPVSGGYEISAGIVLADGTRVASFRATAPSEEDLAEAAEQVSTRLRERLGESLRMIRAEDVAGMDSGA